jgi:cytochrome c
MKKIIVASFAVFALTACGGNDSTENKDKKDASDITQNPDYKKGFALVSDPQNNCLTCHRVDEPLTGPPYRDVANKYAPASDSVMNYLVHKVINGGTGVWGQVPMTPHLGLSEDDARAMVKYIMTLKK